MPTEVAEVDSNPGRGPVLVRQFLMCGLVACPIAELFDQAESAASDVGQLRLNWAARVCHFLWSMSPGGRKLYD